MKASVIIPNHNSQSTLSRTLESVRAAAEGLDVEVVLVDDEVGRGAAWARNQGLARAKGDVIFFVDADDTVERGFFARPLAEMERTGADVCFFSFNGRSLRRDYSLVGNETIRRVLLSAFFGYSFDDVRRWNGGGSLMQNRELGYVWRAAFRRGFLEKNGIRFDESLYICEDAAFLSECAIYAEKVASIPDSLYIYCENPDGTYGSSVGRQRHWEYKFAVKDFRVRLDGLCGGEIWKYCEASCVFSAVELLRRWRGRGILRYISDPMVRAAVRGFPISRRHPMMAAAVVALRFMSCFYR